MNYFFNQIQFLIFFVLTIFEITYARLAKFGGVLPRLKRFSKDFERCRLFASLLRDRCSL